MNGSMIIANSSSTDTITANSQPQVNMKIILRVNMGNIMNTA
jgi:hypothetical protein